MKTYETELKGLWETDFDSIRKMLFTLLKTKKDRAENYSDMFCKRFLDVLVDFRDFGVFKVFEEEELEEFIGTVEERRREIQREFKRAGRVAKRERKGMRRARKIRKLKNKAQEEKEFSENESDDVMDL